MKHLLILPGNSENNRAWGERMASHYSQYFDSFHVAEYAHWKSGEAEIDFAHETESLRGHIVTLPKATSIYIMAKSAGSILAFIAVQAGVFQPSYSVFLGLPFEFAAVDVFAKDWSPVSSFTGSAIAFHNTRDPIAPYEFTKKMLERLAPNISFITLSGDDHLYDDYKIFDTYLLTVFSR